MSDIKDLPMALNLNWSEPDLPEGRTLNADIMPFVEFLAMHQRIGGRNSFKPKTSFEAQPLEALRETDDIMKAIDESYVFSSYSAEPETILFLKEMIKMFKPQVILELGAGLSTLILSAAQKEASGKESKYVSLEQDAQHIKGVHALAEKAKVEGNFEILETEMIRYKIADNSQSKEEQAIPCFDFNEDVLHKALGGIKPDMIIIDGPVDEKSFAGASFAKTLTLPVLSLYASERAVYFMPGAYLDTEIFAMAQWHESGAANVIGVKAAGDGIMIALAPIRVEGTA